MKVYTQRDLHSVRNHSQQDKSDSNISCICIYKINKQSMNLRDCSYFTFSERTQSLIEVYHQENCACHFIIVNRFFVNIAKYECDQIISILDFKYVE